MNESLQLCNLPLFPLESVLFPGGVLGLRIFEVRYLDMVRKCHAVGAPFGVVRLVSGKEVSVAAGTEDFEAVGTLASIETLATVQASLLSVKCVGTQRFRVESRARSRYGLWLADVLRVPDDLDVGVPDDLSVIAQTLVSVNAQLQARGLPGLPEPHRFDDCGWVANRWAEMLPIQAELKQRLMQLDSPLMRLELIGDVMDKLGVLPN